MRLPTSAGASLVEKASEAMAVHSGGCRGTTRPDYSECGRRGASCQGSSPLDSSAASGQVASGTRKE
eukprot:9497026-Pyramimonas_sp.AAC.1